MFFSVVVRVSSSPKQLGKDFGNSSASSLNVHLMPSSIAGDASYFKCLFRKALGPPIHQPPQSPSSPEPSGKETKSGSDGDKSLQQLCQQQRTVRKTQRLKYIALLLNNLILPVINMMSALSSQKVITVMNQPLDSVNGNKTQKNDASEPDDKDFVLYELLKPPKDAAYKYAEMFCHHYEMWRDWKWRQLEEKSFF